MDKWLAALILGFFGILEYAANVVIRLWGKRIEAKASALICEKCKA